MKKIMSLILALVMVFSLCACGGTATEETSGTTDQATNETTEQTNSTEEQEDAINLVGTWVGTWSDYTETLILNEDGTGSFDHESEAIDILWEIKENELELRSAEGFEVEGTLVYSWFHFEIITNSDSIELKYDSSDLVLRQE